MIIVWKVLTFLVCRIEICFKSNFYNPSIFAGLKCIYTHTYIPSIESRTIVGNSCQLCEKRKCSSHSGKYIRMWRLSWKKNPTCVSMQAELWLWENTRRSSEYICILDVVFPCISTNFDFCRTFCGLCFWALWPLINSFY